jgi:hypothetical protein
LPLPSGAVVERVSEQAAMKSENVRRASGQDVLFGVAVLFVVATAIVAGLAIGVHFGE